MKAVMYGAGNIGRGFIGALFSQAGYEVAFVDVVPATVEALNRDHSYPVRIVSTEGFEETQIQHVCAVNGRDDEAVAQAIAEADIMATAVGVNVLKFIAPVIAKGLLRRKAAGAAKFNIIICENLIDANKALEGMLKSGMTAEEQAWLDENVGLVEASIGRMVPVQTPEMQDGNPLRVCVERYGFLPVDRDAFRGAIPEIPRMIPFSPFDYYIRRKLYVHNMGHATSAYLGMLRGDTYIYEAIDDPDVRIVCQSAMTESAVALSKAYGVPMAQILDHVFDLLQRFENRALRDTCARVGGDTTRKLQPSDRLIGSAKLCLAQGVVPAYIALGIAAALFAHLRSASLEQTEAQAADVLKTLCQLASDDPLVSLVLPLYCLIAQGADTRALRRAADSARVAFRGEMA